MRARTSTADATRAVGAALANLARPGDVLVLAGDLGAGKTTLTQGFGEALGVKERITSPTFTIAQRHEGRLTLHHLDLYRLDHPREATDIGLEELIDEGAVVVIEWGDLIEPLLGTDFLEVHLSFPDEGEDDDRLVVLRPVGSQWVARRGELARALHPWAADA